MGYTPPPFPRPGEIPVITGTLIRPLPTHAVPSTSRPKVRQTTPIFRSYASRDRYWQGQQSGPLEYWDPVDESDMAEGPLRCSADEYAAVLRERGLFDVSKVQFRSLSGNEVPRQAPTGNRGTC